MSAKILLPIQVGMSRVSALGPTTVSLPSAMAFLYEVSPIQMPDHTAFAAMQGVDEGVVQAVRDGKPVRPVLEPSFPRPLERSHQWSDHHHRLFCGSESLFRRGRATRHIWPPAGSVPSKASRKSWRRGRMWAVGTAHPPS